MTAFIDASVLVAILAREEDWEYQSDRLDEASTLLWSPVSRWETVTGLRRQRKMEIVEARTLVDGFGEENDLRMVAIGQSEADAALNAHEVYGRNSGHSAKLNMGDCFAYACARTNKARLLYKGEDFALTDLA